MAAVVSPHHHHLFSTLTRFNSTRRESQSQSRGIGVNSVRCSVVSTSESRLVTLSNGNDSLDICRVLNGMWQTSGGWGRIDRDDAVEAMLSYADAGLSTFDMADHYGPAEDLYGIFINRVRRERPPEFLEKIRGLTKWVPPPVKMTSSYVRDSINVSRKRMDVDSLDMLQFHWWDYSNSGYLDALKHLTDLKEEGKIKTVALTNFDTERLQIILENEIPVVSNQVQHSIVDMRPQQKMAELCQLTGVKLITYGTVMGGLLSEKFLDTNITIPFAGPALNTPSLQKYKSRDGGWYRWSTSIFYGVRNNALFCRSWFPVAGDVKGILIIIHGLNEHGGRYADFARLLTSCNFGVYAMDWIGHGGSDGLHGYVPSLDHVVADTGAFLEKIRSENPGIPCFLFGHSTGGAVVLKAASHPHIEVMVEGIILTSPALRVKPAHPIVGAVAPIFSLVAPRFQFKGANKRGIPVSRDPAALLAKYSDPLVYTGPIRVRTGHEILRISSYLMRNFNSVTVPFFVLHGTADKVTDPLASQDLYDKAASKFKDIKLYDGFLHDLLFEPEREEIAQDIINWMEKRLFTI